MSGPGRICTRNASRATLVDTNVLGYPHDPRDEAKGAKVTDVLRRLLTVGRAAVSVQCLTEFYSATTRRLPEPLVPRVALEQVGRLVRSCLVLDLTPAIVLEACRGSAEHRLSLWDGLIWASAKMNGVPYVLTEDAEHGWFLEGVTYLNPFDPRFDLAPLVA